eukprot:scaffold16300_cov150-Cylindrotheca_fusiformis.AAC.7
MDQNKRRKRWDIVTYVRVDPSENEIGDRTFEECRELVQVQLPETLTRIGDGAFLSCSSLKYVEFVSDTLREAPSFNHNLEDGLIVFPEKTGLHIGYGAFAFCLSLQKVIVSSASTRLGIEAFANCHSLISVELPEGLQVIVERLFYFCISLTTVKIPSSVIKIGARAFHGCRSLTCFDLPQGLLEKGESCSRHCVSIETLGIPSMVFTFGDSAFDLCTGLKYIQLPPTLEIIESNMFFRCRSLEYIEIPTSVKKIRDHAFCCCESLSHIRIPRNVGFIGYSAFIFCDNLITLELPDRSFLTNDGSDKLCDAGILGCNSLVNVVAQPALIGKRDKMELFLRESRIGRVVDGYDDFLTKTNHRFDQAPLNKLCYYQSYYSVEEAMVKLGDLLDEDPLTATTQVDLFGMTPLHILSLSQTPNLSMLLAVMNGGPLDHIIFGRDSFGLTPIDYLCLNRMPSSTQVIRSLLQATIVKRVDWLGLERWKTAVLQAVDKAVAVDRSSKRREIGLAYFQLANYEWKEVLSLVELYLWNLKIDEVVSSMDHRADRERCRIKSGASIVIPHVLPFLERRDMEDYFVSAQ